MNERKRTELEKRSPAGLERGDTIVEVLVAIAVLGAVLGGAYVVSNRSTKTNTAALERLEAVKLVETQFEKLKIKTTTEPDMYNWDDFCLDSTDAFQLSSSDKCIMGSDGQQAVAATEPKFHVRVDGQPISAKGLSGARFKVSVNWESLVNNTNDRVDQYYEVYR